CEQQHQCHALFHMPDLSRFCSATSLIRPEPLPIVTAVAFIGAAPCCRREGRLALPASSKIIVLACLAVQPSILEREDRTPPRGVLTDGRAAGVVGNGVFAPYTSIATNMAELKLRGCECIWA